MADEPGRSPRNAEETYAQHLADLGEATPLVVERRRVLSRDAGPEIRVWTVAVDDIPELQATVALLASVLVVLARYSAHSQVTLGCRIDPRGPLLPATFAVPADGDVLPWIEEIARGVADLTVLAETLSDRTAPGVDEQGAKLFHWGIDLSGLTTERGEDMGTPIEFGTSSGSLSITYDVRWFSPESVERLGSHVQRACAAIKAWIVDSHLFSGPSRLPIMSPEERVQVVDTWNRTEVDYPDQACLHELFEIRAREHPNHQAVVCGSQILSYGELEDRSNRWARRLRTLGVGPDVNVGVSTEKSLEMVIGLMAVAKAGGSYVPLDPTYPSDRLAFMLEDSGAIALLTQEHLLDALPSHGAKTLRLDRDWDGDVALEDGSARDWDTNPMDLAYCIYTSGSTGRPKGALLNHQGRVNNFTDFNRRFSVGSKDRVLNVSSLSFDMSAYDVFGTLAAGATLVLVEDQFRLEPAHWAELMVAHGVTVWHSAPALLEMLVDHVEDDPGLWPKTTRLVLLGGDWIPLTLPDRFRKLADEVQVISMGGATEVSMDSTIFEVGEIQDDWKSIPYGAPMANQRSYVLDADLEPVPIGVPGELHLGGVGVGRGYNNRPELTAEKFIPNPFVPSESLYKTGDLARWCSDGNLELVGRVDFQVKVRGFRIELGEIESRLRDHPWVHECVVQAQGERAGDKQLVAYVRPISESTPVPADIVLSLRSFLEPVLPDYMVPSAFVPMLAFPLTPNGKINRRGFPVPDPEHYPRGEFVPTETPVEQVVASVWQDVLDVHQVGAKDLFLDLGGSSLKAVGTATRLRDIFSVDVSLESVLQHPVRRLAQELETRGRDSGSDPDTMAGMYLEFLNLTDSARSALAAEASTDPERSP